jgi:ATP-dependent Clp protease ATP-binding subunit ClpB
MEFQFKRRSQYYLQQMESEKDVVDNVQAIKTEIEDYKYEAERAERDGLRKSSRNTIRKIKEAQERLDVLHTQLLENQSGGSSH